MNWLGLDIGGANLKAANATGWATSRPFALWRDPDGLGGAIAALIELAPAADGLAVTMTGELCDCFRTKTDGVHHILAAVGKVADGKTVSVYLVNGHFADVSTALEMPHLAAASNWRALAQFVCRLVPHGAGLLIDVGSTTSDIIPIVDGYVAADGTNDSARLATRELVYSGVGRTPVCAVTNSLPWHGSPCPIAAEVFSTTADAHLLLGDIAEDSQADWTADGRPLTVECACQRLARQLCANSMDFTAEDYQRIAQTIRDDQLHLLSDGIAAVAGRMPKPPAVAVLSGSGEFLAGTAISAYLPACQTISLAKHLGPQVSQCAPAYAIAILAEEAGSGPGNGGQL